MCDNSSQKEKETMSRMESIVNFKELYYNERDKCLELEKQLQVQRAKVRNLLSKQNGRTKTRYCVNCSANLSSKKEIPRDDSDLISELKDFSQKMESKNFSSIKQCTEPSIMSKIEQFEPNRKRHVGLIENYAVLGIKQSLIKEHVLEGKSMKQFEGDILFSKKGVNDIEMQASKLVFPSGMAIKKCQGLKAKEKTMEIMSYCYTNLKCFVLNFECPDSNFDDHFHNNDLLNHINPGKRLFCICIGIHDYTRVESKNYKTNISLGNIQSSNGSIPSSDPKIKSEGHESSLKKESNKSIEDMIDSSADLEIGITQRVFCIMTYYPFFTFFEQIIRNSINLVKMERLVVYNHNKEDIKLTIRQTDSQFQLQRMVEFFDDCMRQLQFKKVNFSKEYQYKMIDQRKINLCTFWDEAQAFFVKDWIFSILSMFSFDSFLKLLTLIMLEDKVVFICQNSHILTHTIYLFTHVLFQPLSYPFPVVSIIPGMDENYLHAPFPVVYGLLKKRKYIQECNILGNPNYDFTFVFLSPEGVQIFYEESSRKALLNNRSSTLQNNKELQEMFKNLRKSRKKDSKSMKYELEMTDYCILASQEEKVKGVKIVSIVNTFMKEEVVKRLPSKVELQNLKKKADSGKKLQAEHKEKDENGELIDIISSNIKKSTKDPFILQLLKTQTVNNHLYL